MLENRLPATQQDNELVKQVALEEEHTKAVAQADFQTAYQESAIYPLGEQPILVSKVALKAGDQGQQLLCLHPVNGQGLEFSLNDQILHSFCKLLSDSVEKAEWDLGLDFGQAEDLMGNPGLN